MANPPFNQKEWSTPAILDDARWAHGTPPTGNANYAWIQHFLFHLAPNGRAGFVMANGSLTTMTSGEGKIRENLVRADVVDCIVALPAQLFYTTGIPVCLWFLDRDKASSRRARPPRRDAVHRRPPDGQKISRTQIELTDEEIERIASRYHAWRGTGGGEYIDEPGFCRSATLARSRRRLHALARAVRRRAGVRGGRDRVRGDGWRRSWIGSPRRWRRTSGLAGRSRRAGEDRI